MSTCMTGLVSSLDEYGLSVKDMSTDFGHNGCCYIVFDHTSYPNVEAHLFTAGDAALWVTEFTSDGDVVLYRFSHPSEPPIEQSWARLVDTIRIIDQYLHQYRERLGSTLFPTESWAHNELQWYRNIRVTPDHAPCDPDIFLWRVDGSIRSHIRQLNEMGFSTTECCSFITKDHIGRQPYSYPYVMFDDHAYPGVSAHLYTLADMAGWTAGTGRHNFDVVLVQLERDNVEQAWDRLVECALVLGGLLDDYRRSVRDPSSILYLLKRRLIQPPCDIQQLIEYKNNK